MRRTGSGVTVVSFGGHKLGQPSQHEVRGALERVITSPVFRSSPQLAAFLKFIVESALAGHTEDIKGYTIAIKALGRGEDFNPKTDAIVRVEAGRLRRALATYYAEAGVHDPIEIEISARGYVPSFHRRNVVKPPREPVDVAARARAIAAQAASATRPYAGAVVLLLAGAAAYWAVETWILGGRFTSNSAYVTASVIDPQSLTRWRGSPVGPIIQMTPISVTGTPTPPTIMPPSLYNRLRDTFARFDDVTIIADAPEAAGTTQPPSPSPDYKFDSELEYAPDGSFTMTFRLVDLNDGTVAWSRSYEHLKVISDPREIKYPIVREVAATLFQPFGIVKARDRIKLANSRIPIRATAASSRRSITAQLRCFHAPEGPHLPRAGGGGDPTFATGYAPPSRVYLREYQFGAGDQPGDPAMLDTALILSNAQSSSSRTARAITACCSMCR